jgi:hypothetical protein
MYIWILLVTRTRGSRGLKLHICLYWYLKLNFHDLKYVVADCTRILVRLVVRNQL